MAISTKSTNTYPFALLYSRGGIELFPHTLYAMRGYGTQLWLVVCGANEQKARRGFAGVTQIEADNFLRFLIFCRILQTRQTC